MFFHNIFLIYCHKILALICSVAATLSELCTMPICLHIYVLWSPVQNTVLFYADATVPFKTFVSMYIGTPIIDMIFLLESCAGLFEN